MIDCLGDLSKQETSTESLITFAEAGEGSVTCKIKLGIDTLSFEIELFEVRVLVLVLVVVVVLVRVGQNYFKFLLCVSSHSKDFTVLAKKNNN